MKKWIKSTLLDQEKRIIIIILIVLAVLISYFAYVLTSSLVMNYWHDKLAAEESLLVGSK